MDRQSSPENAVRRRANLDLNVISENDYAHHFTWNGLHLAPFLAAQSSRTLPCDLFCPFSSGRTNRPIKRFVAHIDAPSIKKCCRASLWLRSVQVRRPVTAYIDILF